MVLAFRVGGVFFFFFLLLLLMRFRTLMVINDGWGGGEI